MRDRCEISYRERLLVLETVRDSKHLLKFEFLVEHGINMYKCSTWNITLLRFLQSVF